MIANGTYNAINLLKTAFLGVYTWFVDLMNSCGAMTYVIGVIAAAAAIRFLVYPFLKPGVLSGSDRATDRISYQAEKHIVPKNPIGFS